MYRIFTAADKIESINTDIQGAIWDGEIDVLSRDTQSGNALTDYQIQFNHFTIQDAIHFAKYAIQNTIASKYSK